MRNKNYAKNWFFSMKKFFATRFWTIITAKSGSKVVVFLLQLKAKVWKKNSISRLLQISCINFWRVYSKQECLKCIQNKIQSVENGKKNLSRKLIVISNNRFLNTVKCTIVWHLFFSKMFWDYDTKLPQLVNQRALEL